MTDQHPITPPPELVERLKACIAPMEINGCPDPFIDMIRNLLPLPRPTLKEQALKALEHLSGWDGDVASIRRALEQLPDAPAATPDPAPTAGFWERHTMNVCPVCGNKRCPKGADPAMACTGSNEPGQPGSAYADPAPTADGLRAEADRAEAEEQ